MLAGTVQSKCGKVLPLTGLLTGLRQPLACHVPVCCPCLRLLQHPGAWLLHALPCMHACTVAVVAGSWWTGDQTFLAALLQHMAERRCRWHAAGTSHAPSAAPVRLCLVPGEGHARVGMQRRRRWRQVPPRGRRAAAAGRGLGGSRGAGIDQQGQFSGGWKRWIGGRTPRGAPWARWSHAQGRVGAHSSALPPSLQPFPSLPDNPAALAHLPQPLLSRS